MITILREDEPLKNDVEAYSDSIYRLSADGGLTIIKGPNLDSTYSTVSLSHQRLLETLLDGVLPKGNVCSDDLAK